MPDLRVFSLPVISIHPSPVSIGYCPFSWVQNIEDKESAVYLHHEVIEKQYGFLLKLYRSRFLHTDLKAYLGSINLSSN